MEAAELENYDAFEVTEEHEDEEVINEDEVFRLPTASDFADALTVDRKISSSSTCSTASFQSNVSTYEWQGSFTITVLDLLTRRPY